jgi:DNA-binding Lrp family transcriptional regulator
MLDLTSLERALVNRFQGGFPVARRPFSRVAARLGTDEATLIHALGRLLRRGWLTRFGPLYDAERLGGDLVLAALAVPEPAFDRVAAIVNALPEVAHNYRRDHRLNMWFVLATATRGDAGKAVARIEAATGLEVYAFPKEREFYLGFWLELDADGSVRSRSRPASVAEVPYRPDRLDRALVAATQGGLPLVPEPWELLGAVLSCGASEVMGRLERMLRCGLIRRIGAVPNHYRLGLRGNGMTVWDVPDERLETVGRRLASMDDVSHCYARPRHGPRWPYNLFAMVHGPDRAAVEARVVRLGRVLAGEYRSCEVLFSSAVLKKAGLRLAPERPAPGAASSSQGEVACSV